MFEIILKIINLKLQPNLPEANELTQWCSHPGDSPYSSSLHSLVLISQAAGPDYHQVMPKMSGH